MKDQRFEARNAQEESDRFHTDYYLTHDRLNPSRIIPGSNGPDLALPHGRESLGPEALGL
jgi:glutathionyl-hydroquinone reductase